MNFKTPRTLVLLLAGGEGNRLEKLTQNRAKPVVPFAGVYRLIDFPLSNCAHSGLHDVWVVEQFQAHSINWHLGNGRPWDLDKTHGGLQILPPMQGFSESGWHQGNADAIWRNEKQIRAFNPELVLVLSADAIYKLDYRQIIAAHLEKRAELTMATLEIDSQEATRFGNVQTNSRGRVTKFAYKPEKPLGKGGKTHVTTEIFVYDAQILLETLEKLAKNTGKPREEAALSDFGHELLPEFVKRERAFAFDLKGHAAGDYWRDVGTVESYFAANLEFLENPPFPLDAGEWPILSRFAPLGAAKIEGGAQVQNAQICAGAIVAGVVQNSIIGPGATVEKGASVENCVVLGGARICAGAKVKNAVVDEGQIVRDDAIFEGVGLI